MQFISKNTRSSHKQGYGYTTVQYIGTLFDQIRRLGAENASFSHLGVNAKWHLAPALMKLCAASVEFAGVRTSV